MIRKKMQRITRTPTAARSWTMFSSPPSPSYFLSTAGVGRPPGRRLAGSFASRPTSLTRIAARIAAPPPTAGAGRPPPRPTLVRAQAFDAWRRASQGGARSRGALWATTQMAVAGPRAALGLRPHRRHRSGFFGRFHHLKSRTWWEQVMRELRKRPVRVGLAVALVIAVPVAGYGYSQYYTDQVPHSGRKRVMDVSRQEEQRLGLASFHLIKQQFKAETLPQTDPIVILVKKVGNRLIEQTDLKFLNWEFLVLENLVVKSDEINAFVLPGGKVCVFTGILGIMDNEYDLATVLSHEIGHVVARHGAEKWSKLRWFRALGWFTAALISREEPGWLINSFLTLFLTLPFSRKCEDEADFIGLMLMARAGYDPRQAVGIWRRMEEKSPTVSALKYVSTHPTHKSRIAHIENWMPIALEEYQKHANVNEQRKLQ